jgi:hypothetical protein
MSRLKILNKIIKEANSLEKRAEEDANKAFDGEEFGDKFQNYVIENHRISGLDDLIDELSD